VQTTPNLAERFARHFAGIKAAGHPTGPDDHALPNVRGGRISRQRVGKIVREAAADATHRLEHRGFPPLPIVTPAHPASHLHLHRPDRERVQRKWVMSQVGHGDSEMTLDVYAHLEQRAERSHGLPSTN
jgi:hypothetical protein